jgi:gamma-glutamylputrescine oxidase
LDEIITAGEDDFLQLVEWRWRGLGKLRANLGDRTISFKGYGGYELFKESEQSLANTCRDHIGYLNNLLGKVIGRHDIYAVCDAKIAEFGFSGIKHLIENKYEGQLDTGRMMSALIAKVSGLGVKILNNCRVLELRDTGAKQLVMTNQGDFTCRSIIVATNAFVKDLVPELDVVPGRGQVLVTAPIPGLKVRGTFHHNRGYTYFRNLDGRILLGGFRNLDPKAEETTEPGLTNLVQDALQDFLDNIILPGKKPEIQFRWSGVMGFGSELKPTIEEVRPGLYVAARCNGMGVAMGSLIGEQIADLVDA